MLGVRHEPGPSAAELLEASKNLYVKTDILRHKRLEPGQPWLFVSDSENDLPRLEPLPSPSYFSPIPSAYNPLLSPSGTSAFRRVSDCPPPLPPKSAYIKEKCRRLTTIVVTTSNPPPLYPRRALVSLRSLPARYGASIERLSSCPASHTSPEPSPQPQLRPVPKPRLSKMSPLTSTTCTSVPTPAPRRKTTTVAEIDRQRANEVAAHHTDFSQVQRFSSPLRPEGVSTFRRKSITKSTPDLLTVCEGRLSVVSPIRRKILAANSRAPTPLIKPITQEPHMEQYSEERDFLAAAMRDMEDSDEEEEEPRPLREFRDMRAVRRTQTPTTSYETPILVSASPPRSPPQTTHLLSPQSASTALSPSSPLSAGSSLGGMLNKMISSPTSKDSGVHPSDEEDSPSRIKVTKSVDDGFFDSSGGRKTDEESDSSVFTSVTNQPRREDAVENEDRGRPVSDLERKARVMRWINGCEMTAQI